ncbi:MAG: Cbb3-type cytochrome oxidase subunit CcoQ [Pseudomonadota bacterium]|jgi:cytochrome c oxidase cbb3-type subunit 4
MDINVVRGVIAAVTFALFAGIVVWAWSQGSRERFDEAANLPFNEKD